MKNIFKLLSGAYFALASLYCFLACIPYTYLFLVKTPPYVWLSWFGSHGRVLYWAAFLLLSAAVWEKRKSRYVSASLVVVAAIGAVLTWKNLLLGIQPDRATYFYSLLLLTPSITFSVAQLRPTQKSFSKESGDLSTLLPYSNAVLIAVITGVLSVVGSHLRSHAEGHELALHLADLDLIVLVLVTCVWVAVLGTSLLNLMEFLVTRYARRPRMAVRLGTLAIVFLTIQVSASTFVKNSLSFEGWRVQVYTALLAVFLVAWGRAVLAPIYTRWFEDQGRAWSRKAVLVIVLLLLAAGEVSLPTMLTTGDWNGLLLGTGSLLMLFGLGVCVFLLRPRPKRYSLPALLAILVVSGAAYWGLLSSAFLWAKSLGTTDWEVRQALDTYRDENVSFAMAQQVIQGRQQLSCDEFCRTLRQYANIESPPPAKQLLLAGPMRPSTGPRPNIFIIVVDSLRPDYLGVYNPAIDFTPNIDALARDSLVMRNAFTPYAGTSLAEPSIWTGALLLHSHYMRPFNNLNSLWTLAKTDGYKTVVSYNEVLRWVIAPEDVDVRLDQERPWKTIQMSNTMRELEKVLDSRREGDNPIFFYCQPMDVQEIGTPDFPKRTAENWRSRPHLDNGIAYRLSYADQALGQFVAYLKKRGLYDNSIIVLTADHGEATGELGRRSHSSIIYPEVMRVPMIVHLPPELLKRSIYDPDALVSLIDIAPSLYYLLGHRPVQMGGVIGLPMFVESKAELAQYKRHRLLLASDMRAAFGEVGTDGNSMYVTYDSPRSSYFFDLRNDPQGKHNAITDELKKRYDQEIVDDLKMVSDYYGYKPGGGSSGQLHWNRLNGARLGEFAH